MVKSWAPSILHATQYFYATKGSQNYVVEHNTTLQPALTLYEIDPRSRFHKQHLLCARQFTQKYLGLKIFSKVWRRVKNGIVPIL